jgi:ABC transporter substrate binding protein (PQQ-dependent alcohol dehydrogenase system)
MRPEDYAAWMALRAVGEAAIRTQSGEMEVLRDYMLGPDFQLAVFKGVAASFRDWDNQLRQPVLLAADRVVVSVSPQDAFVHQVSPLDTLGTDRPETECRFQ